MSKKLKLTMVEWEIMEAVWGVGQPATVRDVLERAFPGGEKAYTTVQTIMNTLEKKKLLRREKTGLVNFYTPTHSREALVKAEMSSVVKQLFSGSIPALANSLLSMDGVGLDELRKLKALIKEKEKELEGKDS